MNIHKLTPKSKTEKKTVQDPSMLSCPVPPIPKGTAFHPQSRASRKWDHMLSALLGLTSLAKQYVHGTRVFCLWRPLVHPSLYRIPSRDYNPTSEGSILQLTDVWIVSIWGPLRTRLL